MKTVLDERPFGAFRVWKTPAEGEIYFVGVDTAEGIQRDRGAAARTSLLYRDQKPDYSSACVVERETGRHVATWHGDIQVTEWPYVVAAIGFYYNTALIIPEVNGPGIEVVNTLAKRINYPRLYRNRQQWVVEGDDFMPRWGWQTTKQSRERLLARIEEMLNGDPYFTRDFDLVRELRTMEIDEGGVGRARHPNKDDRVFALGLALMARWESLTGQLDAKDPGEKYPNLPRYDREVWNRWDDHCKAQKSDGTGTPYLRGMLRGRSGLGAVRRGRRQP